jgi:hypothetical protein
VEVVIIRAGAWPISFLVVRAEHPSAIDTVRRSVRRHCAARTICVKDDVRGSAGGGAVGAGEAEAVQLAIAGEVGDRPGIAAG